MGASSRLQEIPANAAPELTLPRLLGAQARANGAKPFLMALEGPDAPARSLTFAQVQDQVERLAGLLRQLKLPAEATIALQLPNDERGCIALTAVMDAGLSALVLPLALPEATLVAALEQARATALITLSDWAGMKPAESARAVAARLFGLRFVAAFGANVPDGVIPIDNLAAIWARDAKAGGDASTIVRTLDRGPRGEGPLRLVSRRTGDLVAAALPVVAATSMQSGERILSTMASDDLAGLAAALVPALMTGMPLVMLPLFDSATLLAEIERAPGVHLLVPAAIEAAVDAAGLFHDGNLCSVMVAHRAPWDRSQSPMRAAGVPIIDLISLGEECLAVREREATTRGLPLDAPVTGLRAGLSLLAFRAESAASRSEIPGRLSVMGRASGIRDPGAGGVNQWRPLPWRAECEDGDIVTIRPL
jgi:hypothetical protein